MMFTESIRHDKMLPRSRIKGPHPEIDARILCTERSRVEVAKIAESMRVIGWRGYPLLVHLRNDDYYEAWMGTHRLKAAEQANLEEIPVVEVTQADLHAAGFTDKEIEDHPWRVQEKLAKLADPRPNQLMATERAWHEVRGY